MSAWDGFRNITNSIPGVGGLTTAIFGDPKQEAKQKAMQRAAQQSNQYRAELLPSRLNAMSQMSGAFEPMNNMLGKMYGGFNDPSLQTQQGQMGPGPQMVDINAMNQNPMTQGMMNQISQNATGRPAPPIRPPPGMGPPPANLAFGPVRR